MSQLRRRPVQNLFTFFWIIFFSENLSNVSVNRYQFFYGKKWKLKTSFNFQGFKSKNLWSNVFKTWSGLIRDGAPSHSRNIISFTNRYDLSSASFISVSVCFIPKQQNFWKWFSSFFSDSRNFGSYSVWYFFKQKIFEMFFCSFSEVW